MKTCSKCLIPKEEKSFYTVRRKYKESRCKDCLIHKSRDDRKKNKLDALNAYGGPICSCCQEEEIMFLSIDHINNNGNQHRKEIFGSKSGGSLLYLWLKRNNYPPGFQVLCMNCQFGKHQNGGICPHRIRQQEVAMNCAGGIGHYAR